MKLKMPLSFTTATVMKCIYSDVRWTESKQKSMLKAHLFYDLVRMKMQHTAVYRLSNEEVLLQIFSLDIDVSISGHT